MNYKFAPYSYSKISTYNQCNRKFKYNFIDKAPKSKTDITALLKGGAVHSILENYPNSSTHKYAPKYNYVAENFLKTELAKKYLLVNSTREFYFGLTPSLTPTKYSDKSAIFRGSVDYICIIDGILNLIDWKTGKSKEEKYQDFDQLLFYAIYFFSTYPNIDKIRISYVYVEHDHENDIVLDRKYLDNYTNQLLSNINKIETEEIFEKSKSYLCNYCDFKEHCDSQT